MAKIKLDSGFLILYDWLPAFETLGGDDLKSLLFALIDYQKNQVPIPTFDNPIVNVFAQMIEPTLKRRLDGQAANSPQKLKEKSESEYDEDIECELTDEERADTPIENTRDIGGDGRVYGRGDGRVYGKGDGTVYGRGDGRVYPSRAERSEAEKSGAVYSTAQHGKADADAPVDISEFCRNILSRHSSASPKK